MLETWAYRWRSSKAAQTVRPKRASQCILISRNNSLLGNWPVVECWIHWETVTILAQFWLLQPFSQTVQPLPFGESIYSMAFCKVKFNIMSVRSIPCSTKGTRIPLFAEWTFWPWLKLPALSRFFCFPFWSSKSPGHLAACAWPLRSGQSATILPCLQFLGRSRSPASQAFGDELV